MFDKVVNTSLGSKSNLNHDHGNLVKTNRWTPLLRDIKNLEIVLPNQRSLYKTSLTSNKLL